MSDQIVPVGLDEATELQGTDGSYSTRLEQAWEIWGPSGGYLAALTLRAAGLCAEVRRPASYYCHFLASPEFDEVELAVEVLKRGRRSESLEVRMTQRGRPVLVALVRTAAEAPGYEHQEPQMPATTAPAVSEAFERTRDGVPIFPFWGNVSCRRPDQGAAGEGRAAIREWVRFEPSPSFADPFLDAARPLILLDTFGWPAAYQRYGGRDYVAPNLDTAVWFHQDSSESEWLLIDHENPVAGDGLLGVGGRVWDEAGRLIASGGAQLCSIPRAPR